jgi:hypothetical protein
MQLKSWPSQYLVYFCPRKPEQVLKSPEARNRTLATIVKEVTY